MRQIRWVESIVMLQPGVIYVMSDGATLRVAVPVPWRVGIGYTYDHEGD